MKLYRHRRKSSDKAIREQLKMASGIRGEEKFPHGFDSFVCFDFGDIYVDNLLAAHLNPFVEAEIEVCLSRFLKEDYGLISEDERESNGESRYLGNGRGMIARYIVSMGQIEIKVEEKTVVSYFRLTKEDDKCLERRMG